MGYGQLTNSPFESMDALFRFMDKKTALKGLFCIFKFAECYSVVSSMDASGAFFFTDAIPFSMAAVLEYISLAPIT